MGKHHFKQGFPSGGGTIKMVFAIFSKPPSVSFMTATHHAYRPILPPTLFSEMVNDFGEQDHLIISDYYTRFLARQIGVKDFDLAWVMTEALWNTYRTEPIRVSLEEAQRLQKISDLYPGDIPPLTIGTNAFCYEFPINPPIYPMQKPLELAAMLISTGGGGIGIVWQFVSGPTVAKVITPENLVALLNSDYPKNPETGQPTGFWVAQRRRLLLAYHLCNGLKE